MPEDFVDFDPPDLSDVLWTIEGEQRGHGRFVHQRHGEGKFGEIKLMVTPYTGLHCFRFVWAPERNALPKAFMRDAALAGVKHALLETKFRDLQIAFVQVAVIDGSYHDIDTDENAVATAASMAVQDALSRAKMVRI